MMNKWISVRDKLPEKTQNCLVYYEHCYAEDDYWAIGMASYMDGIEEFVGIDSKYYMITHWMPLPAPPTVKEN